jgi:hypothetical protein
VKVNRDAPAVILYPDHVVPFENHEDLAAETLHGLIDRIIDNFKNKMMETVDPGGPYVHTGPLAYSFKAFQDLDILSRIVGIHPSILVILKKKVKAK